MTDGFTIADLPCVCEAGQLIQLNGVGRIYAVDPANTCNPSAKVLLWAEQHDVVVAAAVDANRTAKAEAGQALVIPCGETWIVTCEEKVQAKAFAKNPAAVCAHFGLCEAVAVAQPRKRRRKSSHA